MKPTLRSEGHIDALAEGQRPNRGALTKAEIRKLYNAGLRAAEEKHRGAADNVEGTGPWHEIALWRKRHSSQLRAEEQGFVNDRASHTVWHEPTKKQGKWLKGIFYRPGAKRP